MNLLHGALDWFARLGLTVRDDPPKTIDLVNRAWGPPAGGLALSIREIPREDPDQLPAVSAVLRNVSSEMARFRIPDWMIFYSMQVLASGNGSAPLTPFGRELLKPERQSRFISLDLAPGEAVETEIPLGSVYGMRPGTPWRVTFSANLPDGSKLISNEISIRL